jgi:hypothetical protein
VIKQIGSVSELNTRWALAQALQTLSPSVSSAQGQLLVDPLIDQFQQSSDPNTLRFLALTIQTLPVRPSDAQAAKAKEWLLRLLLETTNSESRQALIEAFQALTPKIEEAQAKQFESNLISGGRLVESLQTIRGMVDEAGKAYALQSLARTLEDSGDDTTQSEIKQTYELVSGQLDRVTNPQQLRALATTIKRLHRC